MLDLESVILDTIDKLFSVKPVKIDKTARPYRKKESKTGQYLDSFSRILII